MSEYINNQARRAEAFQAILDALRDGSCTKDWLAAYQDLLASSRPEDLVGAVDLAVAGLPDLDHALHGLKPAVSKLINLMHRGLSGHRHSPLAEDFFFRSLMVENRGIEAVLARGRGLVIAINQPGASAEEAASQLPRLLDEVLAIEIHLRKKENILFPWFEERYPQYRCVRLMWAIHDDIRAGLKGLRQLLAAAPGSQGWLREVNRLIGALYFDINTNIFREECALFPVLAPRLTATENLRLFRESLDYGWACVPANQRFAAPATLPDQAPPSGRTAATAEGGFHGRTGHLPPEVLGAMFSTIHLDMTWVDQDDKVGWFSDSEKRVFPRSPAIIGRDVRNCHPGASVQWVEAILDDFRNGRKDHEAFWLELGGRFVHIEYFALRAPDGRYLGTLEASEDLSAKRALTGEKRL